MLGILLGVVSLPTRAEYIWRVYRAGDGLAESLTRAVTASPRGTVWARHGEAETLSVLDGYRIREVPSPGGRIQRVYQSRAGLVWSSDEQGLLQLVDDQWRRHPVEAMRVEFQTNPLRVIGQTPIMPAGEDRVLVLLPDRLIEFRAIPQQTSTLCLATNQAIGSFLDLARGADDGLWISGTHGLLHFAGPLRRLDDTSPVETLIPPETLAIENLQRPQPDGDGGVTCVAEEPAENRRVVVHFDGATWTTRAWPGENPRFAWRSLDPGCFWAMTYVRLSELGPSPEDRSRQEFRAGQYFDVATDTDGSFWLATSEGLARCAPAAWRSPPTPFTREIPIATMVEDDQERLWFATGSGLLRHTDGTWFHTAWPETFEPNFRPGDRLHALPGELITIAVEDQLWTFHAPTRRFRNVRHPEPRRFRKVLMQTDTGALCVQTEDPAGDGAGYRFELFDGRNFAPWPEAPPTIDLGAELFFLARAANGDLWLGGTRGPARWREGKWQVFTHLDGYSDEGALCWLELPDGRIWCGGLSRISEFDGKRWETLRSGLDRASVLTAASDGSVWLAAGSGLHRERNGEWCQIDTAEGLPSTVVHGVLEDRRSRIWAGTSRGLSLYHPRADIDPPITLEVTWEPFPDPDSDTTVRVSFRGRDKWRFTDDERLLYSHRLDEGDWSPFSPDAGALFRDLSSGRHRLEVRAMDRNWNVQIRPTPLDFRLLLPWYRDPRLVAIGVVALLAVLASLGVAAYQHLQLRRSYAEVERQVAERTLELKRATEALVQSQKMTALGTLAAGIAHDFNNILSIIRGSAQIIQANLENRPKVLSRLDRIYATVDQATGVIKAMLGFGRGGDRQPSPCDANHLVIETVRLLGDRFRRELRVKTDLAGNLPPVRAVRDLTQQILLNLILNASDATVGAGQIELRTRAVAVPAGELSLAPIPAPRYVEIRVEDHGCGIPEEIRSRVFEPFFTTKSFSARHGTGLGLYMVYEFAVEMGFGLRLESQVGQGTVFTVILPVAETV